VLWVCSFFWVFLGFSCELAKLLMCILPVYLGTPYAFLMKFLTYQKFTESVSLSRHTSSETTSKYHLYCNLLMDFIYLVDEKMDSSSDL